MYFFIACCLLFDEPAALMASNSTFWSYEYAQVWRQRNQHNEMSLVTASHSLVSSLWTLAICLIQWRNAVGLCTCT